MKELEHITPEKLMQMMQDVIEAGKATNLIKGGYLRLFADVKRQVPKRYARAQFLAATAARRKANKKK